MIGRKFLSRAAVCSVLVLGGTAFVNAPATAAEEELPVQQHAVCVGPEVILSAVYKLNGVVVPQLSGATTQGDTVSVEFTIRPECGPTLLGLAAYETTGPDFDPDTAHLQELVGSSIGLFVPGTTYTLSLTVPTCFYQIDFFSGNILGKLNDVTAPERFYSDSGRLIAWDNAGVEACVVSNEPTTTTTPRSLEQTTTTTTTPTEVLGEVIERPEVLGQTANVAGEELAATGLTTGNLVGTGSGLLLLGSALTGLAVRLRGPIGKHFR